MLKGSRAQAGTGRNLRGRKKRTVSAKRPPRKGGRRHWMRAFRRGTRIFRRAPAAVQIIAGVLIVVALWSAVNWIYQVIRKPSELFFPVSGTLFKTPSETWDRYAPIFRRHSTNAITPELLAALAQQEGAGNPVARTYWRWSWRMRPFEIYRPASSSVGMYQMTDGTFAEAKNYCIHDHTLARAGAWNDWQSCWLNGLYFRVIPSHAVELTAAYLDLHVADVLARHRMTMATVQEKQHLAAVIHLCGAGAGDLYARLGFRFLDGEKCGDHDPCIYLARVDALKTEFRRLAARE
jgi:hypothetical protein